MKCPVDYECYSLAVCNAVLHALKAAYPVPADEDVSPSLCAGHHVAEVEEWRFRRSRGADGTPHTPMTPLGLAAGVGCAALALEAVNLEGTRGCAKAAKVEEVHRRFLVALEPGVKGEMLLDMQSLYHRVQTPLQSLKAEFEAVEHFGSEHLSALETYEYAMVVFAGTAARTLMLSEDRKQTVRAIRRDMEEAVTGYCAALRKWGDYVVQAVALRSDKMGGPVKRVDVYHPTKPQLVSVEGKVAFMRNFPDRQWNALETMTAAAQDHVKRVVAQKVKQLSLVLEPFGVNVFCPNPGRASSVTYLWRHAGIIPGISHYVQDLRAQGRGAGRVKAKFL